MKAGIDQGTADLLNSYARARGWAEIDLSNEEEAAETLLEHCKNDPWFFFNLYMSFREAGKLSEAAEGLLRLMATRTKEFPPKSFILTDTTPKTLDGIMPAALQAFQRIGLGNSPANLQLAVGVEPGDTRYGERGVATVVVRDAEKDISSCIDILHLTDLGTDPKVFFHASTSNVGLAGKGDWGSYHTTPNDEYVFSGRLFPSAEEEAFNELDKAKSDLQATARRTSKLSDILKQSVKVKRAKVVYDRIKKRK